jgi:hypothetical protein
LCDAAEEHASGDQRTKVRPDRLDGVGCG